MRTRLSLALLLCAATAWGKPPTMAELRANVRRAQQEVADAKAEVERLTCLVYPAQCALHGDTLWVDHPTIDQCRAFFPGIVCPEGYELQHLPFQSHHGYAVGCVAKAPVKP